MENTSHFWKLPSGLSSHLAELGAFLDPGEEMTVNYLGAPHDCYIVGFDSPITIDKYSASDELMQVVQPLGSSVASCLICFPDHPILHKNNAELAS